MIKSFGVINTSTGQNSTSPKNQYTSTTLLTYENSSYGIRVKYPSDWSIQGSNDSGTHIKIATFVSPTGPDSNPTGEVAIYMDKLYNSTANLNNYVLYSLKGYENSSDFPAFKLLELNTTSTLAGNPAYALIGTHKDPSMGLKKLIEVGMLIGDKAYIMEYIANASEYSHYLPTAQNMIESLQVTRSPPSTQQ